MKKGNGLKTHPKGPHDLEQLCRDIKRYQEDNPNSWCVHRVQKFPEAREIYNSLRRVSAATFGDQNKFSLVAEKLGLPFVPRYGAKAADMRKKENLDRIERELGEMHTGKDGQISFITPYEVKKRYPGLYQRCVQNGGYSRIMDRIFGLGTYERSAKSPSIHLLDKDHTLESAVTEIVGLHRERGSYVHAIQLRSEHPELFNRALRALRLNSRKSRKRMSYVDFFEKFCLEELAGNDESLKVKFTPPTGLDGNRIGFIGELFSFAALYTEHPDVVLIPGFPQQHSKHSLLKRFQINAPFNISDRTEEKARETYPDVALRAGRYTLAVETKSGLYFWEAREMTEKYHETETKQMKPLDPEDRTKVIWAGVHLHFLPERIHQDAVSQLESYQKKHKRPMKIFPAEYFEGFFSREPLLGSYYAEFLKDPLSFVRNDANINILDELVLGLAPKEVQEAVMEQREKDKTTAQQ